MARKSKTESSKAAGAAGTDGTTANTSAWFAVPGKDDDVVISTRARIVRNLADFPFSSIITEDDKNRVQALAYDAFNGIEGWHFIDMSQISKPGRQILSDKNIIKDTFTLIEKTETKKQN